MILIAKNLVLFIPAYLFTYFVDMTFSQYHPYISPEVYLEAEKSSLNKHEYIQGQIYAMSGASEAKNILTESLIFLNTLVIIINKH